MLKFSFLFVIFLSGLNVFSQNRDAHFIILSSGDTISNIKIIEKYKFTNKDQICYINSNSEKEIKHASEVFKYYNGKTIFYSEYLDEKKTSVFVNYFAEGFCKAGLSYSKTGEVEYYVNNSKKVIPLKNFKYNLDSILKTGFDKFDEFLKIYPNKIKYEYKSLGEFISAYNSFLFPDLYKQEKYINKQSFDFGFSLLPYNYKTSIFNSDIKLFGFEIFNAGFYVENKLTPKFSTLISLTVSLHKYFSDWMVFNYISYKPEAYIQYSLYPHKKTNILIRTGIAFGYNYNLSVNYDPNSSSLKSIYISPFSSNYFLDIVFDFKNHIKLVSGLQFSNINITEQGILSKAIYTKSKMQGIRIGIIYNFKKN